MFANMVALGKCKDFSYIDTTLTAPPDGSLLHPALSSCVSYD
jgi:hypothetical protein